MATISLPRLQITEPLVDLAAPDKGKPAGGGRPTKAFQKKWADAMSGIETQVSGIQDALDLIATQQLAIEAIQLEQADFNDAIANLIITYDAQITSILARLAAAGIP